MGDRLAGSLFKGLWHPGALLPSGMFFPKLQAPACENAALVPERRLRLVSELPTRASWQITLRGRPQDAATFQLKFEELSPLDLGS